METKFKPNLDAQMREHKMPEHNGKWKNFYICTCGYTTYGKRLHNTKDDAAQKAALRKEEVKRSGEKTIMTDKGSITIASYLNATIIQIPVAL